MEDADEDAEAIVREESDEDNLAAIEADLWAPAAGAAGPAAALAAAPAAPAKKYKNKDSSDEECACAPKKETVSIKAKVEKK